MDSFRPKPLFQISLSLLLLFLFLSSSPSFISLTQSKIAPLRITPKTFQDKSNEPLKNSNPDLNSSAKTFYFHQNLDHFTFTSQSYTTFKQRYVIDFKYWVGAQANAPIFAYLGEESSLDLDLTIGFLRDNGYRFKALLVYIEHRYYGKSMPFGSAKDALKNASTLGYFNSAQALADYAAILLHIKQKYKAKQSPIIVIGASYGGMLAAGFRLKYPHIAIGALASSAPVLYCEQDFVPKNGYYFIVTKVFKETSKRCYQMIRDSWDEIDRVAAKPSGLSILRKRFKTCNRLNESFGLKDYLDSIYAEAAQYNRPPISNPVAELCNAIVGAPESTDLLGRIFAGVVSYEGKRSCYDTNEYVQPTNEFLGWRWQTCSEMVMPVGHDRQDSMFQTSPFNLTSYAADCQTLYGVPPRPHWINMYYGSHELRLILKSFGSNIIFSNGLLDPYSVGGVLENISDSIFAITTNKGSHCEDILPKTEKDPSWLVMQREQEIKIIDTWVSEYQKDLSQVNI